MSGAVTPMPLLAIAFIAGTLLVLAAPVLPAPGVLAAVALAALAAGHAGARWLVAALAGVLAAGLQGHRAMADDWPCTRDRESMALTGLVVTPAEPQPGRVDFDLVPDAAARARGAPRRVRLAWYEPSAIPRPGETWAVTARLRCRNGFANPGGFERELDLLRRGLGATGYLVAEPEPRRTADAPWAVPVQRLRAWVAGRIAGAAAGTRSSAVLQGLSVGLRGGIDPALRRAFVDSGTAHLIAISGMHVTAFAVVALWLSRFAYRMAARPALSARWVSWQAVLVCLVTGAYGLLAGASLPTVRTVLMVACALALRAARRHADVGEVLGLSALLLAAADPLGVTSAGFWLSFAAVAALLGLVEYTGPDRRVLREFARAQAAVSLVLAPVLVGAFGGVPLVGPLANAVAIPVFSFVLLPVTLAGMVLLAIAPVPAERYWHAVATVLDRAWPSLEWLAGLPAAVLHPPAAPDWLLGAATLAAVAAVAVPGRAPKWLAAVLIATILWRPGPAPAHGAFELAVLDVGQGLAAVVRTAGRTLVFDTGPRWRDGDAAAAVTLNPYLRSIGVRTVDMVVASHPDADHAGGFGELVRSFAPRWVIGDPGGTDRADEACRAGRRWSWDGVDFAFLHPPPSGDWQGNEASCALRVTAAHGSALLLADTGTRAEEAMLRQQEVAADVVLVPHHGSAGSSSPAFVAAVGATWAVVSAGFGNRWGLPQPAVLARWRAAGAEVRSTAQDGAVRLQVGSQRAAARLEGWREARPRWWRRR